MAAANPFPRLGARYVLAVAGAVSALASGAAAAQADVIIATERAQTTVSAFDGRLVWSSFDPASRAYKLMTRVGGVTSVVPVTPRTAPFDVDLGPNRKQHTAAAYSRCSQEPALNTSPIRQSTARACDLYEFDFTTGRETRLAGASTSGASEVLPSLWNGRLAFVRIYEGRRGLEGELPYLYVTRESGRSRPHRQHTGPRGTFRAPHLGSLDLSGSWLALQWSYARQGNGYSEIRLDRVGGAQRRIARHVTYHGGLVNRSAVSPTLAGGYVYWGRVWWGDQILSRFVRYRIVNRQVEIADAPDQLISVARDGSATYYSRAREFVGYPPACGGQPGAGAEAFPPACDIAQAGAVAFR